VGSAKIIVISGSLRDSVAFQVTAAPRIITISLDAISLFKGQTRRVTVAYTTCHGAAAFGPLTYGSDNGAIASFNNAGLITGLGAGVTSVTVSDGVSSDFVGVTVLPFPSDPTALIALFGFGFAGEMVAGMREEMQALARQVRLK
jgi:hypothetical protein